MDTDLALIIGICVCALAVPGVISAITESRAPRAAAIAFLVGGGLVLFAVTQHPGGYSLSELPDVFFEVVARYIR
ncbi:hypothetical protein [Primorskyibacter sp. S187A]|uniref:hypothetical protein n=1 Tax=Primorskyibacter sp. S187A TaxID=3415130 RepID=UPI003C7C71D0